LIENLIKIAIYEYVYSKLYIITFLYFSFLYFVIAPIFLSCCKYLLKKNTLHIIVKETVSKKQIHFEKLHSLKSIFIFGFSILPIIYLIRDNLITLLPNTFYNIFIGLIILTIWNEIHFFIIHRIMHLPYFIKNVHFVHHKSKVTNVYSVYSFHWLEAILLSTVPITIIPFISFAPIAIFIYPFVSILLNFGGHCNYRFGNGSRKKWTLLSSHHNEHHYKLRKNYAFALNILDVLYVKIIRLITKKY